MMLAISDYSLEISCHNTKLHFCRPDEIKEVTRCDVKIKLLGDWLYRAWHGCECFHTEIEYTEFS